MSVIHPITSTPRICQGPDCPRAREASKACSRCKSIWYCSVECQKAHWSTHKPKCLAGRAQVQPVKEEKGTEDPLALRGGIQEKLKGTALEFMKPRQDGGGMCYPDTYAAYLASKGEPFPEAFLDGHANPKYFRRGSEPHSFELKPGPRASEALATFLKGPTICDCACATAAIYYKTVLDIIGPEKFDKIFKKMAINGAGIGQAADQKGMYEDLFSFRKIAKQYFRKKSQGENPYEDAELLGTIGKRPLEVGDEAHFFGIKCYANKHPEGAGAGLNAICMGNNSDGQQIFMALGLDKPLTELEIYRYLIDDYNQERTALDLASIQKANRPISHGRTENPYMQRYYTVDERDLELFAEYPDLFLKRWTANQHGFEPGSARGINLSRLAAIRDDVVA